MHPIDPLGAGWRRSSRCAHGECIEVGTLATRRVAVRDSKRNGSGPALVFTPAQWQFFIKDVKADK
jgi:Domain of unknown function (DUF397)